MFYLRIALGVNDSKFVIRSKSVGQPTGEVPEASLPTGDPALMAPAPRSRHSRHSSVQELGKEVPVRPEG